MSPNSCPLTSARSPARHVRGGTLLVAMVALVALLGVGMVTVLSIRSDSAAAGNDRFKQVALYAAESGAAAGLAFLRDHCATDGSFFSTYIGTSPQDIIGNNVPFGDVGNPFVANDASYSVNVINNPGEANPALDSDGIVILRVTGFGPGQTSTTIEMAIQSPKCVQTFCTGEFAQKNVSAMNDTDTKSGVCAGGAVSGAGWRTTSVGAL
jgi:hypothetical protein